MEIYRRSRTVLLISSLAIFSSPVMASNPEYGYCWAYPSDAKIVYVSSVFKVGDQWNHGIWKHDFDRHLENNVREGRYLNQGMCHKFTNNIREGGNRSDAIQEQEETKRHWSRQGNAVYEISWKP